MHQKYYNDHLVAVGTPRARREDAVEAPWKRRVIAGNRQQELRRIALIAVRTPRGRSDNAVLFHFHEIKRFFRRPHGVLTKFRTPWQRSGSAV